MKKSRFTNVAPQMLYIIQMEGTSYYKIGITDNINRRFSQLQVGNPLELRLIKIWTHTQRNFIKKYERVLHRYFAKLGQHTRDGGEWYILTNEQMEYLCEPNSVAEQNELINVILDNM